MLLCVFSVFFFKQKTAYEMRISDWSSDVCSSDLIGKRHPVGREQQSQFAPEIISGNTERHRPLDSQRQRGGGDADPRRHHAEAAVVAVAAQRKARPDPMTREEAARRVEPFARAACDPRFWGQVLGPDPAPPPHRLTLRHPHTPTP